MCLPFDSPALNIRLCLKTVPSHIPWMHEEWQNTIGLLTAHDLPHWRSCWLTKPYTRFKAYRELWVCPVGVTVHLFLLEPPGLPSGGGVCFPSFTGKYEDGARCHLLLFSALSFCFPELCHCPITLCNFQCSFQHFFLWNRHYSLLS